VNIVALGFALTLVESTERLLGTAPEPVWMAVWGLVLLVVAAGVRLLFPRGRSLGAGDRRAVAASSTKVSIGPARNWREALVAKLMEDRAQLSS
jgi:hypothetical protein